MVQPLFVISQHAVPHYSTRQVHRGFKAAWKSSFPLMKSKVNRYCLLVLHHGHCYVLVLNPCQTNDRHLYFVVVFLLLKCFQQNIDLCFLPVGGFQSVQYLVLCLRNGLAPLLSVVSNVPVLMGGLGAASGLMWPSPSGCSCCPCCYGLPGRPAGGHPAALWPADVSIWQAGPGPPGCRGDVNRSTMTCRGQIIFITLYESVFIKPKLLFIHYGAN